MTEMFGEAWPPMSVPDLAPDDDDDDDDDRYNLSITQNLCIEQGPPQNQRHDWSVKT